MNIFYSLLINFKAKLIICSLFVLQLVDLPCIIETLKTTDNKTFYKTADISQMLICSNDMEPGDEEAESPKKKKEKGLPLPRLS